MSDDHDKQECPRCDAKFEKGHTGTFMLHLLNHVIEDGPKIADLAAAQEKIARLQREVEELLDPKRWPTPEQIAEWFHAYYEGHSDEVGYKTRLESRVPWKQVPYKNRKLMRKTASLVKFKILEARRALIQSSSKSANCWPKRVGPDASPDPNPGDRRKP